MRLTERELEAWGRRIGAAARPPAFFGLRGPLGAGKSALARAVARGAGVDETMPSPTFNLVFAYPLAGGGSLIHADLYRIGSPDELDELGWDDLAAGDGAIVLVEWPDRAGSRLPEDRWEIALDHCADDEGARRVEVRRFGAAAALPGFGL